MEKQALTFADVEAQGAFELPPREMMALIVAAVFVGSVNVLNHSFNDINAANNWCIQQVNILSVAGQKATCKLTFVG